MNSILAFCAVFPGEKMRKGVEEWISHCQPANFWRKESWVMAILMLFFILFGSLTVMNMLLGVLVEAPPSGNNIEQLNPFCVISRYVWDHVQTF